MKLLSLNIEVDNHLERVTQFFAKENPDVACLQEVFKDDVQKLKDAFGAIDFVFAPMGKSVNENPYRLALRGEYGLLLLSKHPIVSSKTVYYVGSADSIPELIVGDPNTLNRCFIAANIKIAEEIFTVVTTHFTWSPGGKAIPLQRENMKSFLQTMDEVGECVLCGDFNAPRGKEVWAELTARFTDNIPPEVTTTIDQNLHRQHGIQLVVDGVFTTPQYSAQNVRVVEGLSDHKAVVADILLVKSPVVW